PRSSGRSTISARWRRAGTSPRAAIRSRRADPARLERMRSLGAGLDAELHFFDRAVDELQGLDAMAALVVLGAVEFAARALKGGEGRFHLGLGGERETSGEGDAGDRGDGDELDDPAAAGAKDGHMDLP